MSNNKIPKHIVENYGSARRFKAAKREDVRDALRVVNNNLREGCAFFPNSEADKVNKIAMLLEELKDELSVKNWGR